MRRIEPIVRAALAGPCRLAPGARLLVAVSGGADSTALLLALHRLARERDFVVTAAHLDHGLRGAESRGDGRFVAKLCARLGVPLESARWDARRRLRRAGLTGEAGLRALRRTFLEEAARRAGASVIATAHTADDQLETVLMRWMRGTGLAGLSGMRPRAGRWIKPLLAATRREIETDLGTAGQEWREDSSNRDPAYTRNRIRHDLVPALVRVIASGSEGARAHTLLLRRTSRLATDAARAQRALDHAASRLLAREARMTGCRCVLPVSAMSGRPPAVVRALYGLCWKRLRGGDTGLTHRHLDGLERLAVAPRGGASVRLPGGWLAVRDGSRVILGPSLPLDVPRALQLDVPGELSCRHRTVRSAWVSRGKALGGLVRKSDTEEFFAAEGLDGMLELREARADDWFVPFGRRRRVRIAEFLKRQGVSREQRSRPTVLADAGGILWVIGVRRSARAPVTLGTRRVLRVFAENHD